MRLTCKILCMTVVAYWMLSIPVLKVNHHTEELSAGFGMALAATQEKAKGKSSEEEAPGQGPFLGGTGGGPSWEETRVAVPDPLEPMNRAFFKFNDKLYFWFMKPTATVYKTFFPTGVRIAIRNAFYNLMMPVRVVNNTLQAKFEGAGIELARFGINSTLGFAGFFDIAKTHFDLSTQDEDFGQTLAVWGMKPLFYIDWPLLGPSTVRDTIGLAGDGFLDPVSYITPGWDVLIEVKAGEATNSTSLRLGQYEDLKASAIDPYIALRDAYLQNRQQRINK